jgi:hypothetical protein
MHSFIRQWQKFFKLHQIVPIGGKVEKRIVLCPSKGLNTSSEIAMFELHETSDSLPKDQTAKAEEVGNLSRNRPSKAIPRDVQPIALPWFFRLRKMLKIKALRVVV